MSGYFRNDREKRDYDLKDSAETMQRSLGIWVDANFEKENKSKNLFTVKQVLVGSVRVHSSGFQGFIVIFCRFYSNLL